VNIKLTNYPYKGFQVGEICDFGEEKNASLVSLQRAVWLEEKTPSPTHLPGVPEAHLEGEKIADEPTKKKPEPEKQFLQNDLKITVEQKKKKSSKKSFWDTLK